MKVVHVTRTDSQGAGLAAYRIHKALKSIGVNSYMLVEEKCHNDDAIFVADYGSINVFQYSRNRYFRKIQKILRKFGLLRTTKEKYDSIYERLSNKYPLQTYTSPIAIYDLSTHPLVKEADIIHLHWISGFLDYGTFFKSVKKPIVWTFHDENIAFGGYHYYRDSLVYPKQYQWLENEYWKIKSKALQEANVNWVALSSEMKEFCKSNRSLAKFPIDIIHNSVDTTIYYRRDVGRLRNELGIPKENKVIAFCCYLLRDKRKGLADLVQAVRILSNKYKVTLLCIGDTSGMRPIEDISMLTVGCINDENLMATLLSVADYFAMPSYQEAFAQTPIEAMACGLPVIAYPCSGTKELINKENGVICEDFTVDALCRGLEQLLSTKYNKEKICQYIETYFSPKHIAEQYLEVYNRIIR